MNGLATEAQRNPPDSAVSALPLDKESDVSLVILMGKLAENQMLAERAAGELYRRRGRKMTSFCADSFLLFKQNHEELVLRTFKKALHGAAKKAREFQSCDSTKVTTRHVKLWLYKILKRTCIDARRAETLERELRDEAELESIACATNDGTGEQSESCPPRRVALVREFMTRLKKERDRKILFSTMQFIDPSTGETPIPSGTLRDLLKELGMKENAFKTQRFRLLKRLHQYILDNE